MERISGHVAGVARSPCFVTLFLWWLKQGRKVGKDGGSGGRGGARASFSGQGRLPGMQLVAGQARIVLSTCRSEKGGMRNGGYAIREAKTVFGKSGGKRAGGDWANVSDQARLSSIK